ncbi:M3 family metallopeptidase [Aspergillus homomorphus CBS 101889]|uniref:Metalloendopeptidase family saccharolysin n=1 Tax=Aspergillus homomorphus (strain CBS 101889) TaxID=1450537 RepID=A0A395I8T6_ASPHC|nr:metalloendopeptidase family saccharolysin & [Aspergillus homomorphus CBS 101889]RAL16577.1 metalloendopeptidase family saccharolysin & [Aspergillus homomorphus CBS 101889]
MSIPNNTHPLPTFDITADGLAKESEDIVAFLEKAANDLADSVADSELTFDTVIRPLAAIDNELRARVQYIAFFHSVSPSAEIRQASSGAESRVVQAHLALFARNDLFALVDTVHANCSQHESIDEEDRILLKRFHQLFMENGLRLTGPVRERFTWITGRLVELRVKFMQNLGAEPDSVFLYEHDLAGLALDEFDVLEDGSPDHAAKRYRISLTKPVVTRILSQCRIAQTRKDIFLRNQTRYKPNVDIFREIVILRDEASRLLGFDSFAHRKLQQQIVQSPDRVERWLKELHTALRPVAEREMEQLRTVAGTDAIHLWDLDFYHTHILQEEYHVDHDRVAEYFPAKATIERMLGIFEKLFSLRFEKLPASGKHTWHADVDAYAVWEADNSALVFIGYLYVDIYPRPGKYNHAANFNIYPAFLTSEGKRTAVATALVCNVSRGEAPALLRHQEVTTIFHELGHAMHDLLGKSRYAVFHGHRTVADFIEAPSQLLEAWCWVPDCLRQLSSHYSYASPENHNHWQRKQHSNQSPSTTEEAHQPPRNLPQATIQNLLAAKKLNQALLTLRQLAFSYFDMHIHHPASHAEIQQLDISATYNRFLEETTGLWGPGGGFDWGHGHVTTLHYVWGQEANYYSYLFTRMLAADIWASHFRDDPMSREAGLVYRRAILEYGGSRDERGLVVAFLGREPALQAYLSELGCGGDGAHGVEEAKRELGA